MTGPKQRYADVDDRTEELRERSEQHPDIFGDFLRKLELSWIYHENALEGIVVTHAELSTALSGKPIAPDTYLAIRNLKVALDAIRTAAGQPSRTPVEMDFIHRVHDTLGANEQGYESESYRKFIPLHRTYFHDIAQPASIAPRMVKLIDWAKKNAPDDEDVVAFAAEFHHEFMSIFPFPKHSGKLGRLLVNHTLMRHGYLPCIFHASERQSYYETLRQSPKHTERFLNSMMMNCLDNASRFIDHELAEREKRSVRARLAAV